LALLAGRTLLLADDSITIQKIVALTFADEGIEVVAVSNGAAAIEKLEEISPDVVLADVFMPLVNGYQVCEHIKQTESFKHIPVMLLVGSFEPFDEAEARRVGADDILTKPFQSIRTLVDKVGELMGRTVVAEPVGAVSVTLPETTPGEESSRPSIEGIEAQPVEQVLSASEQEASTRELPPPELVRPPEEPMSAEELEITTADTQQLSPDMLQHIEQSRSEEVREVYTLVESETMHTNFDDDASHEASEGFGDALLDLSYFEPARFLRSDDMVLDVDFDSDTPDILSAPVGVQTVVAVETTTESPAVIRDFPPSSIEENVDFAVPAMETACGEVQTSAPELVEATYVEAAEIEEKTVSATETSWMISDLPRPAEEFQEAAPLDQPELVPVQEQELSRGEDTGASAPAAPITLAQLSPEVVNAIARRAVEQLSEKAVQQIAWEVVPQLAELMIKRMLEEHEAQNK
jgi:CheY-like chemotaxis protein